MTLDHIDYDVLADRWEDSEDYDSSWLVQPWDDSRYPQATNDVGAGFAVWVGCVILVEHFDGQREAHRYGTATVAEAAWPEFTALYDDHADMPERACANWSSVA